MEDDHQIGSFAPLEELEAEEELAELEADELASGEDAEKQSLIKALGTGEVLNTPKLAKDGSRRGYRKAQSDPNKRTGKKMVKARLREEKIMALHIEGLSHREIANIVECSAGTVSAAIKRACQRCDENTAKLAMRYRVAHLEKCRLMHKGIWPLATSGDKEAISSVLKIMSKEMELIPDLAVPTKSVSMSKVEHIHAPKDLSKLSVEELQQFAELWRKIND